MICYFWKNRICLAIDDPIDCNNVFNLEKGMEQSSKRFFKKFFYHNFGFASNVIAYFRIESTTSHSSLDVSILTPVRFIFLRYF